MKASTQKTEIVDGFTIKYHANGKSVFAKGKVVGGQPDGYWEWYRLNGALKRSGHFEKGKVVGEWITYDKNGQVYKITQKM
jgi:antitoxin component YwqK of YwqJK toxin-antitoxin module